MIIFLALMVATISTNVRLVELTVTKMQNVLILLVTVFIDAIVIQDRYFMSYDSYDMTNVISFI